MNRRLVNDAFLQMAWSANARLQYHFPRKALNGYCRRHARAHDAVAAWKDVIRDSTRDAG